MDMAVRVVSFETDFSYKDELSIDDMDVQHEIDLISKFRTCDSYIYAFIRDVEITKECRHCNCNKKISEFPIKEDAQDIHDDVCTVCIAEGNKMLRKHCPKCGELKPTSEYYVHRYSNGQVYYQGYCKKCQAENNREWRINSQKYKARHPIYRAAKALPDTETLRRMALAKFNSEVTCV